MDATMNKYILYLILILSCIFNDATGDSVTPNNADSKTQKKINLSVTNPLRLIQQETKLVFWGANIKDDANVQVTITSEQEDEVSVTENELFRTSIQLYERNDYRNLTDFQHFTIHGSFNLTANFVGLANITIRITGKDNEVKASELLQVMVFLSPGDHILVQIYENGLLSLLVIVYITMGTSLDLELIKSIAKRPVGPAIGLIAQYGAMPVMAYGIGLLAFPDDPLLRLGLFASGCAPGGGLSNMWTFLLGGSLDLSAMMTFTSTIAALGTVPLWLLTVGNYIVEEANFVIPYDMVLINIAILITPCLLGIFLQIKCPKVAALLTRMVKPLSYFNLTFVFTFGIYANRYLFSMVSVKVIAAGFGLVLCGHIAGIILALLTRRPLSHVIAISIETAVQNNGITFILLKKSLPPPTGDVAVLIPGSVFICMPIPLVITLLLQKFYQRCIKKQPKEIELEQPNRYTEKKHEDTQTNISGTNRLEILAEEPDIGGRQEVGRHNPAFEL